MDITQIIGLEGGKDSTWFKVLAEEGRGTTKYYPAVVDGEEAPYSYFRSLDDYLAHKVERERETIRLTVAGNAVVAESAISHALGCKALAKTPTTVDVYPNEPLSDVANAASELGRISTDKKIAAVRKNGLLGGRPAGKTATQLMYSEDGGQATIVFDNGETEVRHAQDGYIDLRNLWFVDAVTGKKVRWGDDGLHQVDGGWTRL